MLRTISMFLVGIVIALLGGCASTEQYAAYVAAEKARAEARAASDIARYRALAMVGATGDEAAKVAAVLSIAGGGQPAQAGPGLAPPRSGADTALQWASILVPGLTQAYSINRNTALAVRQSDNALAATQSTNSTMLGFGQLINSPVVVTQPDPVIVTQPAPVIVNPVVVQPEVVQPAVIQIPAAP